MAKSENQKLKLLYISKILYEQTDEDHPISTVELIKQLGSYDIKAERKSIYTDIEALKDFGLDIGYNSSRTSGGYFLMSREFELAELKMLVDMVQASRFLSAKKSRDLIKKLENLTDIHEARQLSRTVYVTNRVKSENETVFYSVDKLHHAINEDKAVTFQYYEYTTKKELSPKKNGQLYHVSPYYLVWANENYYLVGVDEKVGIIKHYRVDRMKSIDEADNNRTYSELFDKFDIAAYTNGVFGMFGGEVRKVTLECNNELIGVIIDRFGKDAMIAKKTDTTFTVTVSVACSGQFYGYLAGLGHRAKITAPQDIRTAYHDYIGQIYMLSE